MGCKNSKHTISSGSRRKGPRERRPSVTSGVRLREHRATINEYMVNLNETKKVWDVFDGLKDGNMLGAGNWGTVRVVTRKDNGKSFACKVLRLTTHMSEHKIEELRTEINILAQMDHPYIAKLYEVYEDTGLNLYLIMELLEGGELYTKLTKNSTIGHYTEKQSRQATIQMLSAVAYLHERGFVHRDLKLENFVYRDSEAKDQLVLIDFGLSKRFSTDREMHDVVGSSYYIAPEVLEGSYGIECDMWSLGVIVFMLLSGRPPFGGEDETEIMKRALVGEYSMSHQIWFEISEEAKDFIRKLLRKDPKDRMTAQEALQHSWLTNKRFDEEEEILLNDRIIRNLQKFTQVNKVKRLALQAVAFSFIREDVKDLERCFESMDQNNDGYVSLEEFRYAMERKGFFNKAGVDNIFTAMDMDEVGKIHLNEFLAATLSESQYVDEMNLLHAFERLDIHHSGKITLENLKEIMGDTYTSEEISKMIHEFIADAHPNSEYADELQINYSDFFRAMQNCPKSPTSHVLDLSTSSSPIAITSHAVAPSPPHADMLKNSKTLSHAIPQLPNAEMNNFKFSRRVDRAQEA